MPHPFQRTQRIGDQIQQVLASLLSSKIHDPRFQDISITGVNISPDMKNATIFVSKLETQKINETIVALNKAAGFFRHGLANKLNLRYTPKLKFVYDDSILRGNKISKLINRETENNE